MSGCTHRMLAAALALVGLMILFAGLQSADPARSIAPAGKQADSDERLTPEQEVKQSIYRYYNALNQVLKGDTNIMDRLWEHSPDVTMFSAFGRTAVGWEAVNAEFQQLAELTLGGRISAEDIGVHLLQSDIAYVTHVEHCIGFGEIGGQAVQPRATKILRRDERGEWRVLHHHADREAAFTAAERRTKKGRR